MSIDRFWMAKDRRAALSEWTGYDAYDDYRITAKLWDVSSSSFTLRLGPDGPPLRGRICAFGASPDAAIWYGTIEKVETLPSLIAATDERRVKVTCNAFRALARNRIPYGKFDGRNMAQIVTMMTIDYPLTQLNGSDIEYSALSVAAFEKFRTRGNTLYQILDYFANLQAWAWDVSLEWRRSSGDSWLAATTRLASEERLLSLVAQSSVRTLDTAFFTQPKVKTSTADYFNALNVQGEVNNARTQTIAPYASGNVLLDYPVQSVQSVRILIKTGVGTTYWRSATVADDASDWAENVNFLWVEGKRTLYCNHVDWILADETPQSIEITYVSRELVRVQTRNDAEQSAHGIFDAFEELQNPLAETTLLSYALNAIGQTESHEVVVDTTSSDWGWLPSLGERVEIDLPEWTGFPSGANWRITGMEIRNRTASADCADYALTLTLRDGNYAARQAKRLSDYGKMDLSFGEDERIVQLVQVRDGADFSEVLEARAPKKRASGTDGADFSEKIKASIDWRSALQADPDGLKGVELNGWEI